MTSQLQTLCEECDKNITMSGSKICLICDPDMDAIIEEGATRKTPYLCDQCFKKHTENHKK